MGIGRRTLNTVVLLGALGMFAGMLLAKLRHWEIPLGQMFYMFGQHIAVGGSIGCILGLVVGPTPLAKHIVKDSGEKHESGDS